MKSFDDLHLQGASSCVLGAQRRTNINTSIKTLRNLKDMIGEYDIGHNARCQTC